jgi:hypothetical protein
MPYWNQAAVDGLKAYRGGYQTYPIKTTEMDAMEGAFKRFAPLPNIEQVRKFALFGLSNLVSPHVLAEIDDDFISMYLTSAINEIEMQEGCYISPIKQNQICDYIEGLFTANHTGIKFSQWPVTDIISVKLKFTHAMNSEPIQEWEIPPTWVSFRNNKMNIAADISAMRTTSRGGDGTIFGYINGYAYQSYRPNMLEVEFVSGFPEDRVPVLLVDLILTITALRMLPDITPILFPISSTSVGIDGVSQSASLPGPNFLNTRIQILDQKRAKLISALRSAHGSNIKITTIGV